MLLRRIPTILSLVGTFFYDLLASSVAVAKIVLSPSSPQSPAIVVYPLDVRTDWGAALMAYFISLTPGSTCIYVSEDRRRLYIHLLNAPSEEEAVARFKRLYERRVLELEQ